MAPTAFIRQQIAAVLGDIGADVAKTGMLPTPEVGGWLSDDGARVGAARRWLAGWLVAALVSGGWQAACAAQESFIQQRPRRPLMPLDLPRHPLTPLDLPCYVLPFDSAPCFTGGGSGCGGAAGTGAGQAGG